MSDKDLTALAICYLVGDRVVFKYLRKGPDDDVGTSYIPNFTGTNLPDRSKLSGLGALAWDVSTSQFHLLLTTDTYYLNPSHQMPCKAFDMVLDVNLATQTCSRLPISINAADYEMKLDDQPGQGGAVFFVNDLAYITASPFFRFDEDGRTLQNLSLPMDDAKTAGLVRQKATNDANDYSKPVKAGASWPDNYSPSPDWLFGLCNQPDVNNRPANFFEDSQIGKFMPSRVTTITNGQKVVALLPADDPHNVWLSHASPATLGTLKIKTADAHWAFIKLNSSSAELHAGCPVFVQGSDANAKPHLYVFFLNAQSGDNGSLSYIDIPLLGNDSRYGDLDLPPATSTITVDSKNLITVNTKDNQQVIGDKRKPLQAVFVGTKLAVLLTRDSQIYLLSTDIEADGKIFKNAPAAPKQVSTDGGCKLLGACAFASK